MADEVSRRLVHVTGATVPLAHLLRPDLITWRIVQG
ncbi:dolichol kinase, partial [Halomicrobium sp. IBSBa]|nr:dolichol kinase [Halomicrobium sp. IBSBa]